MKKPVAQREKSKKLSKQDLSKASGGNRNSPSPPRNRVPIELDDRFPKMKE
ncbi:hypothetical protein [Legionella jordanis]|uniref:hypothetical protein n=1 Tax=Legionella jordanis TaxID=456 RepID=UPI00160522AA|nr:hypothetical protein [Legionella jordanis]